ncbi:MAG TPA: glycosyltransferase [Pyrinomonadaceae bacterium]|jgi:2-deoxystreptamine N-acetyl-D-glucosaminyltransferase/2-deoxystreptamine glucosyltransferase|nr:glycosyltransferase [Pyrinomonadaceae bacterium]
MKKLVLSITPSFYYPDFESHWNPRFDPVGGMHLLSYGLTTALASRGVPHEVLTTGLPGMPRDWKVGELVVAHRRLLPVLPVKSSLEGHAGLVKAWAAGSFLWILSQRARLRREVAVVHSHCDGSASVLSLGYLAARVLGCPLVTQIYLSRLVTHDPTTFLQRLTDPLAKRTEAYVSARASAVLVLTEHARREFIKRAGVDARRIERLACLTTADMSTHDTEERRRLLRERFRLPDDRPVVMYLGRIAAEKGCEFFVDAAGELARGGRYHFVICGDGPDRGLIEGMIGSRGLSDAFTITGFLPHYLVPSMIHHASVGVVPSRYEELGLSILEFMAMRRPVVVHDVSAVKELVRDRETGILVKMGDTAALAAGIKALLDDPALAGRIAEAAVKIPRERFSIERSAERLLSIYRTLGLKL